jgi:hypothetical protein
MMPEGQIASTDHSMRNDAAYVTRNSARQVKRSGTNPTDTRRAAID